MSDRYIVREWAQGGQAIWCCTEEGEPVQVFRDARAVAAELNHLWLLVDQTSSRARMTERTNVQRALLEQNFDRRDIEEMKELPEPPSSFSRATDHIAGCIATEPPPFAYVEVSHQNRLVRALKAIAAAVQPW